MTRWLEVWEAARPGVEEHQVSCPRQTPWETSMRQRRRVGGNCVKDSGRRWEETRDNVASRHGDMATVPHSPATAPGLN